MAKLADALDLGSSLRVWVRVPPSLPNIGLTHDENSYN
ncbi:hypothetical protein vBSenS3_84 [Salmonella phage vB_SenS-3]|nr:hypothetical protein vBSenS3_84 [Salmonella phage vB_SenS-3]